MLKTATIHAYAQHIVCSLHCCPLLHPFLQVQPPTPPRLAQHPRQPSLMSASSPSAQPAPPRASCSTGTWIGASMPASRQRASTQQSSAQTTASGTGPRSAGVRLRRRWTRTSFWEVSALVQTSGEAGLLVCTGFCVSFGLLCHALFGVLFLYVCHVCALGRTAPQRDLRRRWTRTLFWEVSALVKISGEAGLLVCTVFCDWLRAVLCTFW